MASYYKIIDGIKYDRSLLEYAEVLIRGRGDGRISEADAIELLTRARDGWQITLIEMRTLEYIQDHFTWTDKAYRWWKEQVEHKKNVQPGPEEQIQQVIRYEYRLEGLNWNINPKDVAEQSSYADHQIAFPNALREALRCFLFDESDYESPRRLVRDVHGLFAGKVNDAEGKLLQQLLAYLNGGTLYLIPWFSADKLDRELEALPFSPPEWGERPEGNWLFGLSLPSLSDHLFWAVVDRYGKRASYCYGFN